MPWGISESAYNARDLELTYQYSSFGVPGPGPQARPRRGRRRRALRDGAGGDGRPARGGAELRAPAPTPAAAAATASTRRSTTRRARLPEGETRRGRARLHGAPSGHDAGRASPTRCTTASMRARFHAEPIVQATELLLQERTPRDVGGRAAARRGGAGGAARARARPAGAAPLRLAARRRSRARHLLSNGRYAVMVTAAGSGYSRWRDLAVTRWREDVDARRLGQLRLPARRRQRRRSGRPATSRAGVEPDSYEVDVRRGPRRDPSAATARSRPRSRSSSRPRTTPRCAASRSPTSAPRAREIELTSYAEIVLAPPAADAAHPAFSNLFVQTEFVAERERAAGDAPAARRRDEPPVWAAHVVVVEGETRRRRRSSRPTGRASSAAAAASARRCR